PGTSGAGRATPGVPPGRSSGSSISATRTTFICRSASSGSSPWRRRTAISGQATRSSCRWSGRCSSMPPAIGCGERAMDAEHIRNLIDVMAARVIAASDELTALDQAIGDGDHGINMKRGFEAVRAEGAAMAASDLPAALHKLGMTLVMKVGGASGPLYGTLFMALGKAMPAEPDRAAVASALSSAIV